MAIVFVSPAGSNQSSAAGVTIAVTAFSVTAGNLVVAAIGLANATSTISSFVDTLGNSWTASTNSPQRQSTNGYSTWFYYSVIANGGSTDVTVTFNSAGVFRELVLAQFSGSYGVGSFDKETFASATTSSIPDPGTSALTSSSEAIIEMCIVSGSSSAGTGFTSLAVLSGNASQYKIVSGGSWGTSAFNGTNSNWLAHAVTFQESSGETITVDKWYRQTEQPYPVKNEVVAY